MTRTLIIAEAGVNHNGSVEIAKALIDAAKNAGADIVKFQTFKSEKVVSKYAPQAEYQKKNAEADNQLDMVKKLELTYENFAGLNAYANNIGIQFLSTPFDLDSIEFLDSLNIPFWKIPSGEITNYPYLVKIAQSKRAVVMSTGMSEEKEIAEAMKVLNDNGSGEISLLHCNTAYPTPFSDVNLQAMLYLRDKFHVTVGYSDHTQGIEIPVAAVALGAQIIEKHFTLDKNMIGPDHKASIEPNELKEMVTSIRHVEQALGVWKKTVTESEIVNKAVARKSIVAKRAIKRGEIFSTDNLSVKRPGTGISPMEWPNIIGNPSNKDYQEDELIKL